jgi:hypothetical protein
MNTYKTKIPHHMYYKKIDTDVFPEKVTYYSVIDHRELSIEDIIESRTNEEETSNCDSHDTSS